MLLARKIQIRLSEEDAATLEFMQGKCRGLYNWLVMRLRSGERWHFKQEKATLKECRAYDGELNAVYGKLLAEVYFRLDKAMQGFFRRLEAGEKPGFPRVRPRHQFFTLCYPAAYLLFEGKRLILPTGGKGGKKRFPNVLATLAEVPPCGFREVAISRDVRGHYFASFVYEAPEAEPQPGQVVAFDLGIKTLAVGVNEQGRVYSIGGMKGTRWYNRQLDKLDAKRAKCQKKSRRYLRLAQVRARVSEKKRNKRRDCLHKASHLIAHRLVESTVVIGDLSQRQMVTKEHEAHLKAKHRAVYNDWGLYDFVQMLVYKCLLAGKLLEMEDEHDTSKTCSRCGQMQPMPLYKRVYRCSNPECLLVLDRDENSARNILQRFLARLGPSIADAMRCADVFTATDNV
ncbi:MAG TPA: transposase [Ktedonobacterales bacterium]|jgi:putative transposase